MIEVVFTYDFLPGIDENAYAKLAHKATRMMTSADGFVEFHANRNLVGSPLVRRTSVWESFAHYAAFAQQPEFQQINNEFRTYVTNLEVSIWGPSPLVPGSIKPEK
jgi:heme-degrading monooxygenase HmoA